MLCSHSALASPSLRLHVVALGALAVAWIGPAAPAAGQQDAAFIAADPSTPLATIDGVPVLRGELNLVLAARLGGDSLQQADPRLVQAAALMLVRRHLAMKTLLAMGGPALAARVDRALHAAESAAQRQGDSLQSQAERRGADAAAMKQEVAWQTAWQEYLRSRLTDENLRRFLAANRAKYDGTRVRVSQIFFPVTDGDPGTALAALRQLAEQISLSDDLPAAFALAARDLSHGGSADEEGRLGWITGGGDVPAEVADAALHAEPGQVVGPVTSPLGLHLLLIHQRQAGAEELDTVEDQAPLRRDAADALFNALVRRQSAANVQWLDDAIRPPADTPVIP